MKGNNKNIESAAKPDKKGEAERKTPCLTEKDFTSASRCDYNNDVKLCGKPQNHLVNPIYFYRKGLGALEKRRVKLNINGVVCGLITSETDEYMQRLSLELSQRMSQILASSPFITRESAALMVALNYCDEGNKSDDRLLEMKRRLQETEKRALETERQSVMLKKENAQLWEETAALLEQTEKAEQRDTRDAYEQRIADLETENALLRQSNGVESLPKPEQFTRLKNPLRHYEVDQQEFISFFEKKQQEYEEKNESED